MQFGSAPVVGALSFVRSAWHLPWRRKPSRKPVTDRSFRSTAYISDATGPFLRANAPISAPVTPLSISSGSDQYHRWCELLCSDSGRTKAYVNGNRNAIPRRVRFQGEPETHPGVRGLVQRVPLACR